MVEQLEMPQHCLLAHNRLAAIEDSVSSANDKLDTLLSYEGPISAMRERIALVEKTSVEAHNRIDGVEVGVDDQRKQTSSVMLKVAGLASLMTSGLVAAIIKFLGG